MKKFFLALPLILGTVACSSGVENRAVGVTFMGIDYSVNCELREATSEGITYTRETMNGDADPIWEEVSRKGFDELYSKACN